MHKIMSYEIFFLIIYSDLAFASRTGSRWKTFEREAAKVLKSRAKFIKMALSFISPRANTRTLVCLVGIKRRERREWNDKEIRRHITVGIYETRIVINFV